MRNKPYEITRFNAWLILIFGVSFGLYDSTTTIYISYPYTYEFNWWLFIRWCFGTYCISMVLYSLSELLKRAEKKIEKTSYSLIDVLKLPEKEMDTTNSSETTLNNKEKDDL
ncbi:hypothetical protein [Paenibacillus harenae]|uniref:Uncharacterized protein n=1 Tax=Paenibacillus harenae TaxID=306543 RepID=A0ABT9TYJ3_PAEHA|nr:hypothetical protein [Paenibacillus harenae]MDQ0112438.1 hypothetical protein [Paenibacillus harenae]